MVYTQPIIRPRKWNVKNYPGFWDKNGSTNSQQEKRTCRIVNFAVSADHRVKLKESEKRDKYEDLAREMNKQWNMKVTVLQIVMVAFGRVNKWLIQDQKDLEIRVQVHTI